MSSNNIMDLIMGVSVEQGNLTNLRDTLNLIVSIEKGINTINTGIGNLNTVGPININSSQVPNIDGTTIVADAVIDELKNTTTTIVGEIEDNRSLIKDVSSGVGYIVSNLWRVANYESSHSLLGQKYGETALDPTKAAQKILKADSQETIKNTLGKDHFDILKNQISTVAKVAMESMVDSEKTGVLTEKGRKLINLMTFLEAAPSSDISKLLKNIQKAATDEEKKFVKKMYGGNNRSTYNGVVHVLEASAKILKRDPPGKMIDKKETAKYNKYINLPSHKVPARLQSLLEEDAFGTLTEDEIKEIKSRKYEKYFDVSKNTLDVTMGDVGYKHMASVMKGKDKSGFAQDNLSDIYRTRFYDDAINMSNKTLKRILSKPNLGKQMSKIYEGFGMTDKKMLNNINTIFSDEKVSKEMERRKNEGSGLSFNIPWGINGGGYTKWKKDYDKKGSFAMAQQLLGSGKEGDFLGTASFKLNDDQYEEINESLKEIKIMQGGKDIEKDSMMAQISGALVNLSKKGNDKDIMKKLTQIIDKLNEDNIAAEEP